jgi:FtsZ-binding cell division protein ZapB
MEPNLPAVDLEKLEGRVQQAAELILKLRTERDGLRRERDELEAKLRATESTASGTADELRKRNTEAEARVARFAEERVALARRVEQMLEKLRAVEEEKAGAPN